MTSGSLWCPTQQFGEGTRKTRACGVGGLPKRRLVCTKKFSKRYTAVAKLNFGVPDLAREFPKVLRKGQIKEFSVRITWIDWCLQIEDNRMVLPPCSSVCDMT